MRLLTLIVGLGLLAPLAAGCDSGDTNPDTVRTYVGTFAGGASGAITVTIEGEEATATFATAKSSPEVSGSFNPATGALNLSGGGYTFTGTLNGNTISGTWTGPNGTSGVFTTTLSSGTGSVTVFCGGWDGTQEDGTLNIVVRGSALTGLAVSDDGDATELAGQVDGSAVEVWVAEDPSVVVATGTIDGTSLTGTFDAGGNSGTWEAFVCAP